MFCGSFFYLFTVLYLAKAQVDFFPRIVDGFAASIKDYPYQVALLNEDYFICGGSIISKEFILTAAHCTYSHAASNLRISAGASVISEGKIIPVKERYTHPNYVHGNLDYDISVLRLRTPLKYGKSIQPVALPKAGEEFLAGTVGVVSGWGTLQQERIFPTTLQAVNLTTIRFNKCKFMYPFWITERMMCASQKGSKGFCNGDSGGPFVVKNKLFGIVSWTIECGDERYPSVFVRVALLRAYIKQITGL